MPAAHGAGEIVHPDGHPTVVRPDLHPLSVATAIQPSTRTADSANRTSKQEPEVKASAEPRGRHGWRL